MGDKDEKRARSAEPDESSRKAPCLEPQDSACDDASDPYKTPSPDLTDSGLPGSSDSMEVAVGSDTSSDACRHFLVNQEDMQLLSAKIESLKCGLDPACEYCKLESAGMGLVNPHKQQLIMVCTQCDQCLCLCSGVSNREDQPQGHARTHALRNEHWVALWLDKPTSGYCFVCDSDVYIHASLTESEGGSSVNDESLSPEVEPASAGGHAHASGSNTDDGGYVIRGIPNIALTCYMNVLVQCLLVLDKLRTAMLRPSAPKGPIGTALKELFLKTRASYIATEKHLNPRNLLKSMRALDPKYNGCKMHDSHELLCSMRDWLNAEELKRPPNTQDHASGAVVTTIVDSIFQGMVTTARTNACCQYQTVDHALFYELSLPLASEKHSNKSIALLQRNHRSQQKSPVVKHLFPAVEELNTVKVQTITDGGASGNLCTEMQSEAMEKSLEPLEFDSSESEQIQRKSVVHGPLLTHKDVVLFPKLTQEIVEVPVKPVALLPDSVFSVKVEEHKATADANIPEDTIPPPPVSPVRTENASVALDSDLEQTDNAGGAFQSCNPEADIEAKENMSTVQIIREVCIEDKVEVTNEDIRKAMSCNFAYSENAEGSNGLGSITDCLELFLKEEVIERRCEKCFKVAQQSSTTESTQGYKSTHADQKVTISNLPPVLTVQLMRFNRDEHDDKKQLKIKGHVSFEEILDVRQFMEPSSEDKDHTRHCLAGVIEHIGDSLDGGHVVAYVRASRVGSNKQLSSDSSPWFRADDDDIKQVSLEEVLKCEAFVLFYERIEG